MESKKNKKRIYILLNVAVQFFFKSKKKTNVVLKYLGAGQE